MITPKVLDVVDAIHYIVSMAVRSWMVDDAPITLVDADRIGSALQAEALNGMGMEALDYRWQPVFEVLVAPAFTMLDGVDAESRGALPRFRRLLSACERVRSTCEASAGWAASSAKAFLDQVETDAAAGFATLVAQESR